MRKIVFGFLISMLMIGSVLSSATIIENNMELKENFTLFEIEDGEISQTIPIGNYEIVNDEQGDRVHVEDFGSLLIPGKPQLPTKIFAIAIPPGAEFVELNYEIGEGFIIPGEYNIIPNPLPKVIGIEDPEVRQSEEQVYNENYETTYQIDNPYPDSIVDFERTAGFRKYNLVDIRINPISYQPLSGVLTYYPDITVHVSYSFPEGYNPDEIMVDTVESFEQRASEFILNHGVAKEWYPTGPSGRETYDYVIITTSNLENSVTDLADWEEAKGKNVKVVTTSWINSNYDGFDSAAKIRNFLRDKYPTGEWGIEYVCLIGSYDDVMIRRVAQSTGYGQPETDFYHAELTKPDDQSWDSDGDHKYCENSDPIDFYAEVYVGRIPWSSSSTVEDICEKTVAYEQNNDESYKKNILLIGTYFWPDTDNAVLMEYKTDETIHPWMEDWTRTTMYEEAQSSYPCDYDVSYANVKNVWSSGTYAFVDWAGHGSPTACYEYYPSQPFVDTDTCNYLNDNYPAIVFADACSNSDTDDDNIGQMMIKQGAIGFLGATKVAYGKPGWTDPNSGSSQSMDYYFTTGCTEGELTQGQSHQLALQHMYEDDLWYYQKYEHCQWGALWGNPDLTMGVVSQPPVTPAKPSGPEQWAQGVEVTFEATTTDPDGDSIYYWFDWGDGENSGWEGPYPSGNTCDSQHTYPDLGDYNLKVKAKDTNGVESEWSEIHVLSIVENAPPLPPTINGPSVGQSHILLNFEFSTIDPEGHKVYYYINWNDGHYQPYDGPYESGEKVTFSHSFSEPGTYTVISKAKDQYDASGQQSSFKVLITRNRAVVHPFLLKLLERIIAQFPLLAKMIW